MVQDRRKGPGRVAMILVEEQDVAPADLCCGHRLPAQRRRLVHHCHHTTGGREQGGLLWVHDPDGGQATYTLTTLGTLFLYTPRVSTIRGACAAMRS